MSQQQLLYIRFQQKLRISMLFIYIQATLLIIYQFRSFNFDIFSHEMSICMQIPKTYLENLVG